MRELQGKGKAWFNMNVLFLSFFLFLLDQISKYLVRHNMSLGQSIEIIPNFSYNPEGSCLIKCGDTHVICSASLDRNLPRWLKNSETGWVTAEYGMLPRSTSERMSREATKGKQSGRTQEIQRLIGRSLRSIAVSYTHLTLPTKA